MALSLFEIVEKLGGELIGDDGASIHQVAPLDRAVSGEIGFVAHVKYRKSLLLTKASAVVLPSALADATSLPRIVTADPYLYFAKLTQLLNPPLTVLPGVHPSAVVMSFVPATSSISALVFIGEKCVIGERVRIGPGCVLEAGSEVGDDSVLYSRVTLYPGTKIGRRCLLHSGCVLGSDGFGFARTPTGQWEKIPQIGRVIVGDDVEIGANTAIDRGALDDTVIERGVKLDNLIQVAHNCRVGEDSALAGQSGLAGSTSLGKRVMVGGQAGIMGHVDICDDVIVSARSFASKTLTSPGVYTSAIPSQSHKQWLRNAVHLKSLDEMASRIRVLENKINILENEK